MVDSEVSANLCGRMDINSRFAMRHLRDDAGNQRNTQFQQFMRDTVIADRFNGRIAKNYLSITFGSRIAVIGGFHIGCQYSSHGR